MKMEIHGPRIYETLLYHNPTSDDLPHLQCYIQQYEYLADRHRWEIHRLTFPGEEKKASRVLVHDQYIGQRICTLERVRKKADEK